MSSHARLFCTVAVLLLALLAFPYLSHAAPAKGPDYGRLIQQCLHKDTNKAVMAREALIESMDPAAADAIFAGLKARDPRVRMICTWLLGKRKDVGAAPALLTLLGDSEEEVRFAAIASLGRIKDPRSVAPLAAQLTKTADAGLVVAVLSALGEIGPPAIEVLREALSDAQPRLRRFIIAQIGGIDDPRAREMVYAACGDDDAQMRAEAVGFLRAENPRELELLYASLKDPAGAVCAKALRQFNGHLLDARAIDLLLPILSHEDSNLRQAAADRLACFRDPRLVEPMITFMQNPDHRVETLTVLEMQRDPRAIPALTAVLSAEPGEDEVLDTEGDTLWGTMAMRAMVRLGRPAVEPLLRLARATDPMPRCRAARALGELCHPLVIPALINLLGDQDQTVRLAAIDALGQQADMRGYEALLPLLEDPEAEIRQAAAQALAGCRDSRIIEPLAKMLSERDLSSRASAAAALGYVSDPRVPPLMLRALRDKADLVYMSALQGDGRWVTDRRIADVMLASCDRSTYRSEIIDRLRTADAVVVPVLLQALTSRDARRRIIATEALGAFQKPKVREALLKAMNDRDRDVRDAAGRSLGEFTDPTVLPKLAAMLTATHDAGVRANLIWSMRFYGTPATDVLLPLLAVPCSEEERHNLLLSLGHTKDRRAMGPLIAELQNTESPCRWEAAQALIELGDAQAVEPFIAVLQDADENVRNEAIAALGRLKDRRALEPLMHLLPDEENAYSAAGIINSLRLIGDPQAMNAIRPYLEKAIAFNVLGGETQGIVLEAAIRAAGELGDTHDTERLRTMLQAYLFDVQPDPIAKDCCRALTRAVGVEKDERTESLLIAAFREDLYAGDPTAAAFALARLDTPRAADALCAGLTVVSNENAVEDRPILLGRCLGAMTWMPWERLVLILQSDNWRARQAALTAFAFRNDLRAIPLARQALIDQQPQVRAAAAEVLGRLKAKEAGPALTKALNDPYPEVRTAAKAALAAIGE